MWRRAVLYGAVLGALSYCAKVALLAVHECGHLIAAFVAGAELRGFRLYRISGGSAFYEAHGPVGRLVGSLGGVAVESLVGVIALLGSRRATRPLLGLFLAVFGVACLVSPICYTALGLYYEWGDPASAAYNLLGGEEYWRLPLRARGWWIPALALVPLAAYATCRVYVPRQARWLPIQSRASRARFTLLALAVGLTVVIPLLAIEYRWMPGRPSASMASQRHASEMKRAHDSRARYRELLSQGLESREAWKQVHAEQTERPPAPAPPPFPIWAVIAALALGAGVVALLRDKEAPPERDHLSITRRDLMVAASAALSVLLLLLLTQGDFAADQRNTWHGPPSAGSFSARAMKGDPHAQSVAARRPGLTPGFMLR